MRLRLSSVILPAVLLLTPVSILAQEHVAEEGGGGLFSINLGLSIWTVVLFVCVLTVLWRFAFGPILAAVQAREEGIQQAMADAKRRQ